MIDVDGVLADFVAGFSLLAHLKYNLPKKTNEEQESWDWVASGYCTREQESALWNDIRASRTFWATLPTLASVTPRGLEMLQRYHATEPLIFVTSRCGLTAWSQTITWLQDRGIHEPLVVIANKHHPKPEICKTFGLEAVIEDSPMVLEDFYRNHKGVELVKIATAYNRGAAAWRIVANIEEALDLFDIGIDDEIMSEEEVE
jgi:hypothetical protein